MSKSKGNVVDPCTLVDKYGAEPLRYFLSREVAFGYDQDFSEDALIQRLNSDLANDLGNLLHRITNMVKKYRKRIVPAEPSGYNQLSLLPVVKEVLQKYHTAMIKLSLHRGIEAIWELIHTGNRYVDENKPWELAKDETQKEKLDAILFNLSAVLKVITHLIHPFLPESAKEMAKRLDLHKYNELNQTEIINQWSDITGNNLEVGKPLFPRIEIE